MIRLQTPVEPGKSSDNISYKDKILVIGSCFADNIGRKLEETGFDVCVNPFGTLYNPQSIYNSLKRLAECSFFTQEDCVEMGSGAGLICSFSHHTSFARKTAEDFLENANCRLDAASVFFRECNRIIITLGTSWCYRHIGSGDIVSNCLKIDTKEFVRELISPEETASLLTGMMDMSGRTGDTSPAGSVGSFPADNGIREKSFIVTVSPIRHLKDGAHGNQLSKASLLLAADSVCRSYPDKWTYFPSYEIMMDELRDYRFYAEDMVHPSELAVKYIWEHFRDFAIPAEERGTLAAREKEFLRSRHIQQYSHR